MLFDEGAQRSFISQEFANKLQLQPIRHENICVSSFGAQVSAPRKLAVASVLVHTLKEGPIPVSVLIVPKLAAPIRNSIRAHLNNLPHLKGLQLAHPVTSDENFRISILIGADFYWQFIQDRVIPGDGPTAVESNLGYLLSGPLIQLTQLIPMFQSFPASLKIQITAVSGKWSLWVPHQQWRTHTVTFYNSTWTQRSSYYQMGPIVSSFHGRLTIHPFPLIMPFVLDGLYSWLTDWPRPQIYWRCMTQSSNTKKKEDSLRK